MFFLKRHKSKDPNKYNWVAQYQYKTENGKYKTFNVSVQEFRHMNLEDPLAREDFVRQYSSKGELDKLHARRASRSKFVHRKLKERPTNYLLDLFYENRKHMSTVRTQLFNINEILNGFCAVNGTYELDTLGRKSKMLQNWLISRPNIKTISTVNNKISDFNQFLRILYDEGKMESLIWISPVSKKRYPELAGRKKGIEVVMSENVEELLRQALPEKYRLQFDVMIGLGLRVSEPNRIHLLDVYLNATPEDFPDFFRAVDGAGVKVFGVVDIKYQRSRATLAEAKAKTIGLVGVLSEKTQVSLAKAWLEANAKGQTCLFEHIPPMSFESAFQVAISKLPAEYRHLSPHDLRHTFCTRAAAVVPEPCRDLLMTFTRHSNWTVCERYRHNLRLLKGKKIEVQTANFEFMKAIASK